MRGATPNVFKDLDRHELHRGRLARVRRWVGRVEEGGDLPEVTSTNIGSETSCGWTVIATSPGAVGDPCMTQELVDASAMHHPSGMMWALAIPRGDTLLDEDCRPHEGFTGVGKRGLARFI